MKTGEDVHELGIYASDCCLQEILFDSGDSFSRCPRCLELSDWEMVDIASSWDELQALKKDSNGGNRWVRKSELMFEELRHSL